MLKIFFKYLVKLAKDRVFQKSILHFAVFFAVVASFVVLTQHHVITRKPQPSVPHTYAVLADNTANVMSPVDLERLPARPVARRARPDFF